MNLTEILTAYRNHERGLPDYTECAEIAEYIETLQTKVALYAASLNAIDDALDEFEGQS